MTQKANPRAFPLPEDAAKRKKIPLVTGLLDYFPNALAEVAKVSLAGSKQHHPGEPLHWDRDKSTDHADCIGRHLVSRGTFDTDGKRHSAKMVWRALALLQEECESEHYSNTTPPANVRSAGVLPFHPVAGGQHTQIDPDTAARGGDEHLKRAGLTYQEARSPKNTWECRCDTGYVCQGCDTYNDSRPYKRPGPTY